MGAVATVLAPIFSVALLVLSMVATLFGPRSKAPARRGRELEAAIDRCVKIGRHRTLVQDSELAIAQIVEIAIRALSPAVNDTFTGVACVDWLTDALLGLAEKSSAAGDQPARAAQDLARRGVAVAADLGDEAIAGRAHRDPRRADVERAVRARGRDMALELELEPFGGQPGPRLDRELGAAHARHADLERGSGSTGAPRGSRRPAARTRPRERSRPRAAQESRHSRASRGRALAWLPVDARAMPRRSPGKMHGDERSVGHLATLLAGRDDRPAVTLGIACNARRSRSW
ncbi:MAG TPA: DUF2254 family protein [Kofleriaceae bacterium]|nr:DUF2254 family protein [Kofleriaceae bacterium]